MTNLFFTKLQNKKRWKVSDTLIKILQKILKVLIKIDIYTKTFLQNHKKNGEEFKINIDENNLL